MDNEFENIVPWNGAKDTGRDVRLKWQRNFERIKANFEELSELIGKVDINKFYDTFIRKDQDDSTKFLVSFLAGAVFGKDGFAPGLTGFGAKIDERGFGEMRGLTLWEWLQVPELRCNRVEIVIGDKWRSPGGGIIESCTPDTDEEGNPLNTGTCTLKLEDGEYGAVEVGDMCMGIFHFGDSRDATETSDDSKGNFTYAGFATAYWLIKEVSGDNNGTFRYSLREGYNIHPCAQMHFSCRGNVDKEDRQTSVYETRTYTRMLWKQNTWEIGKANIAMQYGDLSNLNVFGLQMDGYSMYLNSVYFTGTIAQVKPDGTPVRTANDRGAWPPADNHADYFDRFSYNGCIWLCVAENGTDTPPADDNAAWLKQVDKGNDGEDGTSVRILGSKDDPSQLPLEGNNVGDGYLIDGHLWVWNGSSWTDAGQIQGPAGQSVTPLGNWYAGLHVPYLGVVRMGASSHMCNVKNGTDNPPMWVWTDGGENLFTYNDGSYVLTGEANNAEYLIIATDGADAKSIQNVDLEYAISSSNSTAPTSGWQTTAPTWENGKYIWSRSATYFSDGTVTYTDAACISGGKGIKKITEWYYRSSSATELIGGEWSTEYPGWINGTYIWTRSIIEYTDGTASETTAANVTGSQGEGYTNMGSWKLDMLVPKLGVVSMGGSSWTAKVATRNPPLYVWTDKDGNLFTYSDGQYVLTGEKNTEEYDLLAECGQDGDKGEDGKDGEDGEDGKDGKDAVQYEYIYQRTTTYSQPSTPGTAQSDNYVPSGWSAVSEGISATYPYEWRCQRTKSSSGIWSSFSTPKVWAKWGEQGIQGCIIRTPIWEAGREYRNDSSLTGGTSILRYIDVAFVQNIGNEVGWDAYQCKQTHVSSTSLTYTNTAYWEKLSVNVTAILASLIIAKNAKITFLQGNQLLIMKDDGTITLGLSGSEEGAKIRLWIGGTKPDIAAYRVNEKGEFWSNNAHISGEINATSGMIGGLRISGNSLTNVDSNNDAGIYLRNSAGGSFAAMGGNVVPAVGGFTMIADFENTKRYDLTDISSINYGVKLLAQNARTNIALTIDGGCVQGFAMRNTIVNTGITSKTLTRNDYNVICNNTGECTITLPSMQLYDDGHVIRIKRLNGNVLVKTSYCYVIDPETYTSKYVRPIIIYSDSQAVTGSSSNNLTMNTKGDGTELVWVRDYIGTVNGTTYYGAWIANKISYI